MIEKVTITECDLEAYIDDQLDAAGRLEVADYLVRHPTVAARVLADLRFRDAMRVLGQEGHNVISPGVANEARRLDTALGKKRVIDRFGRTAPLAAALALVVLVAGTWQSVDLAPSARAAIPAFVEAALMSKKTAEIRARMPFQPETRQFDPKAVKAATRIDIPDMPSEWRILDAQIFPSDYGPSIQMFIDTGDDQPVSLFAARSSEEFSQTPETEVVDGQSIEYWSREGTDFALTGEQSLDAIAQHAEELASGQDL